MRVLRAEWGRSVYERVARRMRPERLCASGELSGAEALTRVWRVMLDL